jgi:hypothetical protein
MNAFVNSAKNKNIFKIFCIFSVCDKAKFIDTHIHIQFLLSKTYHFIDYTDYDQIIEYVKLTGKV